MQAPTSVVLAIKVPPSKTQKNVVKNSIFSPIDFIL